MATPWLLRAACDLCRSPADIETLRPVLDALGTHGKSPWKLRDTSSLEGPGCLYDTFARHGASDAILAWCWSLPDAPKHLEKDLDRRVRSDRLREQLDRSEWTGEPSKLRQMLRAGNKWTEIWADGQTTWERALGVQLPIDALARRWDLQALFDGCSAARRVEGIRRMAASFLEEAPHDKAVFAAVLWAGWMGLEENERAAGSVRDPLPPWSKRDWRRPFRGLVKDVAHARGWEGPPAAWEERAWDEAWNWAASRPPSKALAQVAWAAAQARCEETWDAAKSRGDNSSPPIDPLMDETCRRFCRKTLTQSGAVLNAFLNSISTQEGLPSASRPGHGFLWVQKVALPEDPTETWWWAWAYCWPCLKRGCKRCSVHLHAFETAGLSQASRATGFGHRQPIVQRKGRDACRESGLFVEREHTRPPFQRVDERGRQWSASRAELIESRVSFFRRSARQGHSGRSSQRVWVHLGVGQIQCVAARQLCVQKRKKMPPQGRAGVVHSLDRWHQDPQQVRTLGLA